MEGLNWLNALYTSIFNWAKSLLCWLDALCVSSFKNANKTIFYNIIPISYIYTLRLLVLRL